jgi:hypothetical protein
LALLVHPLTSRSGAEIENTLWLEFLNKDSLNLLVIDVNVPLEGIEDWFDDVIDVTLHDRIGEIEKRYGKRGACGKVPFRKNWPARINNSRLPLSDGFMALGLQRNRRACYNKLQWEFDFNSHGH